MKRVYTQENRYLVHNMQNIVENNGIETLLKNEYAGGAVGDLVPHETWLELWVKNDSDFNKAMQLINDSLKEVAEPDWICHNCREKNASSFEFCWNCQESYV